MATHKPITSALWEALSTVEVLAASLAPDSVRLCLKGIQWRRREQDTQHSPMYVHMCTGPQTRAYIREHKTDVPREHPNTQREKG